MSINRAILKGAENNGNDIFQNSLVNSNEQEDCELLTELGDVNDTQESGTNVAYKIIKYADISMERIYLACCHTFTSTDDILEVEETLAKHCIDIYWKVVKKSQKRVLAVPSS